MEENNISIKDKWLEAISAAGAFSPDGYIDITSISFDEFLATIEANVSDKENFPPKDYESWRQSVKDTFEHWQAFAKQF